MKVNIESIFRDPETLSDAIANRENLGPLILRLTLISAGGLAVYGASMGAWHSLVQVASSAIKLPLLFFGAGLVTLPALHFIGLHLGSRMSVGQTLVLFLDGLAVTAVLAAAFAPIAAFFVITGSSYQFMILVHVTVLGFCASAGISTMSRALDRVRTGTDAVITAEAFWCFMGWVLLFGFVGTEAAYLMRPFIGEEGGFVLFSGGEDESFAGAVVAALGDILLGRSA